MTSPLHEFGFEVNLRTIVREDKSVVFEAWAWVPRTWKLAQEYQSTRPFRRDPKANEWVRVAAQGATFDHALRDFYRAAHDYCQKFWETVPEPTERPKRKVRRRHKPFLG